MYTLNLKVKNKLIDIDYYSKSPLIEGSFNIDEIKFEFAEDIWNELEKTAVFVTGNTAYKRALIDNKCIVPKEIYKVNTELYLGVFGSRINENQELEQVISCALIKLGNIEKGSYREASEPGDLPEPSQWDLYVHAMEEYLAEMNVIKEAVDNAVEEIRAYIELVSKKIEEAGKIADDLESTAQEMSEQAETIIKSVEDSIEDFNSNATLKTNTFNTNATDKLSEYNTNDTNKISAYNLNVETKTNAFNDNAINKTNSYNTNAETKTTEFNTNATNKTTDFDNNASTKTTNYNTNATEKTEAFNSNATSKTNDFNTNAEQKTEDFNENVEEITQELEDLRANQIIGYAEGSNFQVTDSADAKIKGMNKIAGEEIKQKTYKGNQLIDFNNLSVSNASTSYTFEDDILTVSCTASTYNRAFADITSIVKNNPNKTLYIKCDNHDKTNGNIPQVQLAITNNGATSYITFMASSTGAVTPYVIPSDTVNITNVLINFYCNNSSTVGVYSASWTKPIVSFTENVDYEPFVGGIPSPNPQFPQEIVTTTGDVKNEFVSKNLIDLSEHEAGAYLSSGVFDSSRTEYWTFNYIPVNEGETYNLSIISTVARYFVLAYLDKNKNVINVYSGTPSSKKYTFNIPVGAKYIRCSYQKGFLNAGDKLQLEKGSTATDYVPHEEQVYTLSLGNIELVKIGTVEDYFFKENGSWYLKKAWGKVVLDGTQTIGTAGHIATSNRATIILDNLKPFNDTSTIDTGVMCNKLIQSSNSRTVGNIDNFAIHRRADGSNEIMIRLDSTITTRALFNEWLSNNTPIVYYELATPTDTEITDQTLISQLEALSKARTYKNITNVQSDCILSFSYIKDLETVINNLSNAIVAAGGESNV